MHFVLTIDPSAEHNYSRIQLMSALPNGTTDLREILVRLAAQQSDASFIEQPGSHLLKVTIGVEFLESSVSSAEACLREPQLTGMPSNGSVKELASGVEGLF